MSRLVDILGVGSAVSLGFAVTPIFGRFHILAG